MEVKVTWQGEDRYLAEGPGGRVTMDRGSDGPGPMEMVLYAIGGCTAIDVTSILNKMRLPLERLEIEVNGRRAEEPPQVYTEVTLHYHLWGDLPVAKVERTLQLTQEKYCSVLHMVNKTATVNYDYTLYTG